MNHPIRPVSPVGGQRAAAAPLAEASGGPLAANPDTVPFRALLDALPTPLLVLSGNGRIVYLNVAAGRAFNLRPGEKLAPTPRQRRQMLLRQTADPGDETAGDFWQIDSNLFEVCEASLPFPATSDLQLLLLRDVTGQMLALRRLRQNIRELRQAPHPQGSEIQHP